MAQLIVSMNLSMDGYIEAQGQDEGSWLRIDEAVHRAFNELASAEAFLYRRKVYEVMIPYWPDAVEDTTKPAHERDYGRIWVHKPKVVAARMAGCIAVSLASVGGRVRDGWPEPASTIVPLRAMSRGSTSKVRDSIRTQFGFFRTLMSIELTKDAGRDDMIRQVTALEKKPRVQRPYGGTRGSNGISFGRRKCTHSPRR